MSTDREASRLYIHHNLRRDVAHWRHLTSDPYETAGTKIGANIRNAKLDNRKNSNQSSRLTLARKLL